MAVLYVGQGPFRMDLAAALKLSRAGDELELDSGEYVLNHSIADLTLRAASNERPIIAGQIALSGKSILHGLEIRKNLDQQSLVSDRPALLIKSGAQVRISSIYIHDVPGCAIWIESGGVVECLDSRINDCVNTPVYVTGNAASITLTNTILSASNRTECVNVVDAAEVNVYGGVFEGALVFGAGGIGSINNLEVRSKLHCLAAQSGAQIKVTDSRFFGGGESNVVSATGLGTHVILEKCSIEPSNVNTRYKTAIHAEQSARVDLQESLLIGPATGSLFVIESAARSTLIDAYFSEARGLSFEASSGATVQWQRGAIARSAPINLADMLIQDAGTIVELISVSALSIAAAEHGQVILRNCKFYNETGNSLVLKSASKLHCIGCEIGEEGEYPTLAVVGPITSATLEDSELRGYCWITEAAQVTFNNCRIEDGDKMRSVVSSGPNTNVTFQYCHIQGNQERGGVLAEKGGSAVFDNTQIAGFSKWQAAFRRTKSSALLVDGLTCDGVVIANTEIAAAAADLVLDRP